MLSRIKERHAKIVAWLAVVMTLSLVPLIVVTLSDLRVAKGDILSWLVQGTDERDLYTEFAERFGSFDNFRVSWEGATPDDERFDIITAEIQEKDRQLANESGEPRLVERVTSYGELLNSFGAANADNLAFQETISEEVRGFLISQDESRGCLFIESTSFGAENRGDAFDLVDTIVRAQLPEGIEPIYDGPCYSMICANEEMNRIIMQILPLSALVSFLVALVFLKDFRLVLVALMISGFVAALTMVVIQQTGSAVGDMVALAPTLAQLIAMSNIIHLINYYREALRESGDKAQAWRAALANGWLPTVASTVSTALGLAALFQNSIHVVTEFAIYGIVGLALAAGFVLLLVPAVLILLQPDDRPENRAVSRLTSGCLFLSTQHAWKTATLLLLATFVLGAGLFKLTPDVTVSGFFPEDAKYTRHSHWFEDNIGKSAASELQVKFPENTGKEDQFHFIEDFLTQTEAIDSEYISFSALLASNALPEVPADIWWAAGEEMGLICNEDGFHYWRLMIRHPYELDSVDQVKAHLDELIGSIPATDSIQPEIQLTGLLQLYASSQQKLIDQLLRTFLLAFLMITPLTMIFLRSIRVGLIAIVGNVFPMVVFFGVLGWVDFRIDIATMMTAAVAFGIAIDDTMHFLTWLSRGLRKTSDLNQAIRYAFSHCAGAIIQTTLIISLGLSVYFLCDFQPSIRFAIFSAIVLILAVVGDLILLPALMTSYGRKLLSRVRKTRKRVFRA